ncbi:MFS transporter [Couchioplanes azureus]|uniref:MFS transporter n=1 Tax=Couchioplanes caeruleus TaxID=56438 RepID=UPI00166FAA63|nr:MFS transporter [Couchioplanes caeruleus]GGQ46673.1 MFS transporter [Couchioplanes caeruleus subsp. azureus]
MSTLAPLRHAGFRRLLAGRTITALGNAIAPVALAFAVLDLTGSAGDLGLVLGSRMLAHVLVLLVAGALADRLPKSLLMVGSGLAAAVTQGAVAALVLTGTATVPLLIALSAVNGMVAAVALPASSAILPQLVPAEHRQQANGLNRLVFNGAYIVGAPVGGILVATTGPGWGIAVDALSFLLSAACFAFLRIGPRPGHQKPDVRSCSPTPAGAEPNARQAGPAPVGGGPAGKTGMVTDLREGWSEFRSRTWLWVVVAAFCLINACLSGGINVLGPLVADQTVGRQAWGFVLAAQTAGMVLGAVVAMRVRARRLLLIGVLCTGFEVLPLLTLGLAPRLGLLVAAAFVAGFTIEQFVVAWETSVQEHVPADRLARVYSYDMVGSFVAIPVGQVAAGPVAEAVGVQATLVGAACLVALAVLGMLSSREVRGLRHRCPQGAPSAAEPMEELAA